MPLADLHAFNVNDATVSLWVFKKSGSRPPVFTGKWIDTEEVLDNALKAAIQACREKISETHEYGLLAQNNESSALSIPTIETHAGLILAKCFDETAGLKARRLKDIQNSVFYVVKLTTNNSVLYAVRKTDDSWRAKTALNQLSVLYSDEQLTLEENPAFNISKHVDFFILDEELFIENKSAFESVLNYKEAHKEDFVTLRQEEEFQNAFTDLAHLIQHVGDNKIQLRRACAIKEKGHYRNAAFMESLRQSHAEFGLEINFNAEGKIVPTPETCKDILRALLDHRLISHFSRRIYDVEDTSNVAIH